MFAFPVLLGDIGGTNARFAVLPAPGDNVQLLPRTLTHIVFLAATLAIPIDHLP